jgi:hypothetical protein
LCDNTNTTTNNNNNNTIILYATIYAKVFQLVSCGKVFGLKFCLQISQKSGTRHKILSARNVTWTKFHIEDAQTSGPPYKSESSGIYALLMRHASVDFKIRCRRLVIFTLRPLYPGKTPSGTFWVGGCVIPRNRLDMILKKSFDPPGNPGRLVRNSDYGRKLCFIRLWRSGIWHRVIS